MSTSTRPGTTADTGGGRRTGPSMGVVATSLGLSVVGLLVAAYLTYEHFSGGTFANACSDNGAINCAQVTTSRYSHVLGVPVVIPGLVFFVVCLALFSPWAWRSASRALAWARLGWTSLGVLSVFYLVYAELVGVGKICLYCTAVHVITLALFVLVLFAEALAVPDDLDA